MPVRTKRFYDEMNIARGIGVLLVVIGHSSPRLMVKMPETHVFEVLIRFVYGFHMAVFMFISGFLASKNFFDAETKIAPSIRKNALRLLVPYAVMSVLTLVVKQFWGAYATHPFVWQDAVWIVVGMSPHGGMWFLWSLFVLSSGVLLLKRFVKSEKALLGAGVACFVLYMAGLPWSYDSAAHLPVKGVLVFAPVYAAGMIAARHYDAICKWYAQRRGPCLTLAVLGMCLGNIAFAAASVWFVIPVFVQESVYLLTAFFGLCFTMECAARITGKPDSLIYKITGELGRYGYDIYILTYFVMVPARIVMYDLLQLPYALIVLLMIALCLAIPYLASKYIVRRVGLFRKLLLGDWK